MMEIILGISAYYHDSAACIIKDGAIVAAAQEERFTRKKHESNFPSNALNYVLNELDADSSLITHVAFYDKPLLKFERLLETYHGFVPSGIRSFYQAIPVWLKEKLHIRRNIRKELKKYGLGKIPVLFPEHHLSHAASAYFPSPFGEAAILTVDGVGEWSTTTLGYGSENKIQLLKELHFPHSLGLLYSAFTYYCGFRVNSGEYKLMGLAPYGQADADETKTFKDKILNELIDIREDGSFLLNMKYFDYATGLKLTSNRRWTNLFGMPPRKPETEIGQPYCNLALAIQQLTEQIVIQLATTAKNLTGSKNLVLAGGVALNSVANGKLQKSGLFEKIWIQPAAGDAGGALGAAFAVRHIFLDNDKPSVQNGKDLMQGAFLGPEFTNREIFKMLSKYRATATFESDFDALYKKVAALLDDGKIAGWFQDRMEFGPRALGNRSILADARNREMQKRLNLQIKFREGFRPFAPAVLWENTSDYFDIDCPSPYMLLVCPVKKEKQKELPDGYDQLPLLGKLYTERSDVPAVTHIDYSARVQTVHRKTNPKFHRLLETFKSLTGCPVIINTSFNVRGEPIVCTPEDAFVCFMRTDMDYLVLGDYLLDKREQKNVKELSKFDFLNSLD